MQRQPLAEWVRERDDPKIANTKPEALDDLTVLDLSYNSYAGLILQLSVYWSDTIDPLLLSTNS